VGQESHVLSSRLYFKHSRIRRPDHCIEEQGEDLQGDLLFDLLRSGPDEPRGIFIFTLVEMKFYTVA